MKKHFSFIIGLFLVMFTSLHCFAASSEGKQYVKARPVLKKVKRFLRILNFQGS